MTIALESAVSTMSAAEVARAIRNRTVSSVEMVEAYLQRIAKHNPGLNAYVFVDEDGAQAAARQADSELARGVLRGPLHGVPVAIKDLFDFKAGTPNSFGLKVFADYVPEETASHVARLEAAGAVILGKTNTPELGHKATTDNRLFGPTSTPFRVGYNAGGSSGGSAAAVAAGMCALAQGSDGGGSVRIPAAMCGVVGFKPTFGRIDDHVRPDAFLKANPFMGNGPLARTVEDCALLLNAMVGFADDDPGSVPQPNEDFTAAIFAPVRGLRVAYLPTLGGFPVHPEVGRVVAVAVQRLEEAGVLIDTPEFSWPAAHHEITDLWVRMTALNAVSVVEMFADLGVDLRQAPWQDLPPQFRTEVHRGYALSATEIRRDQFLRTAVLDTVSAILARYDAIVSPTLAVACVPNAGDGWTVGPDTVNGESVDPTLGWCLTHPFNFTGHPAISVPAGRTPDGFPVGLQIAGRRFADSAVLSLAAAYERIAPWHNTYASLLS